MIEFFIADSSHRRCSLSSKREVKKILSLLDEAIKEVSLGLAGAFRVGKPLSPRERVAKADEIIALARAAVGRITLLQELETQVEKVEEQREAFVKANKLNSNNSENRQSNHVQEEEPVDA